MSRRPHRVAALTLAVATIAVLAALFSAPARAINTYNADPAPERTEVGAFLVLWDRSGDGVVDRFDWYCSGAMISDEIYLTAAHCVTDWPEGSRFFVSLLEDVQTPLDDAADDGLSAAQTAARFLTEQWAVEGDVAYDPAFPGPASDTHDIGVVDFRGWPSDPQDVWNFTPATLPTAGFLNTLGPRVLDASTWWVVGYGTEEALRGPGGQTHPGGGVRMKAELGFDALTKSWVHLAMREAQGWGGACYGDSGGPNFIVHNGQLILAATTVTGDAPCYATNVVYRTDTAVARAFLDDFVTLP